MHYLSPEVVEHRPWNAKTDIWSLGVTLCALLTGRLPFIGSSNDQLFRAISAADVSFDTPEWARVSPEGKACVRRMLTADSAARPTAAELLADEWLRAPEDSAVNLSENLPQLRAFLNWRTRWRATVHAVRAVNILASPLAALRARTISMSTRPSAD